jgi:hypothetical protein
MTDTPGESNGLIREVTVTFSFSGTETDDDVLRAIGLIVGRDSWLEHLTGFPTTVRIGRVGAYRLRDIRTELARGLTKRLTKRLGE